MLSALVLLPAALDGVLVSRWGSPRYRYLNRALAAAAGVACVVLVAGGFAHPASWFTRDFPSAAADRVAAVAARDPRADVFANERFADWLLFEHPALAGRIAFDGRFELLSSKELERVVHFRARIEGAAKVVRPYRLLVLDPSPRSERAAVEALLSKDPSRRAIYRDSHIAVIEQPGAAANTAAAVRPKGQSRLAARTFFHARRSPMTG
jgi:hypothetical protein